MPDAYSRVWEDFTDDLDAEQLNDLEERMEARVAAAVGILSGLVPETNHYPYFISSVLSGQLPIATDPTTEGYTGGAGNGVWGFNPGYDRNPTNSHKWLNIDAIIRVNSQSGNPGTANRAYFRSANLSNLNDPSELNLMRVSTRTIGPGTSLHGYGENDDGSDLSGIINGTTIGFVVWKGAIAVAPGNDPSTQADSARIGVSAAEDVRQDNITVTLAGSTNVGGSTITVNESMDDTIADDGTPVPFEQNGLVQISGQKIRYASRSATKLFGCTNGSGTVAGGTGVNQTVTRAGGTMSIKTSTVGSGDSGERLRFTGLGGTRLGQQAVNTNNPTWWNICGGQGHYETLRDPINLTATVIGATGSAHYTYYIVGRDAYGGVTNSATIAVTNGRGTLDDNHYIFLEWDCPLGVQSFDIIRSVSTGTPSGTGPIILGQKVYEGQVDGAGGGDLYGLSAVDNGLSVTGINEVQTIVLLNTDGGTWRGHYDGGTTNPIDFDADGPTDIQAKFEALGVVGAGNIAVTNSGASSWRFEFQGSLAASNVPQITADISNLTNSAYDPDTGDGEPPGVQQRTRTEGGAATYSEPTRNTTGDFTFDGAVGFNGADPSVPDITGSRSGGTALFNLLTALEGMGLITDSTTA